ncbi:histone-lysine N-methyltransferase Smyd1-like [Styela clava]|uniref:histone-lysine N-methyltransferase Smyd1-like n=1 Tax=Styela clava TaxID=7725 RepID=UPI00193957C5|nr:histone-lysine N-methyltransferase Smyd1-like [Styela clava]
MPLQGIEVVDVAGKGRGLCATQEYRTGQVVIRSRPYEHVIFNEQADKVCHHCVRQPISKGPTHTPPPLLKCGSCKFARYCNKDCQKAAWEAHKPECAAIKRVFPNKASDQTRLVARLFWRKQRVAENKIQEDLPILVEELESHVKQRTKEEKEQLDNRVFSFGDYVTYEAMPESDEVIYQWFGAVDCNAISLNDQRGLSVVGVGIFLDVALLNHDCNPNCVAVNNGAKVEVRSLRPIKPQEELCISYIDPIDTTPGRQEKLKNQYYFDCKCEECENGSEREAMKSALLDENILKEKPEAENYIIKMSTEALKRMENTKKSRNFERLYNQALGALKQQDSVIADSHVLKIAVLNQCVEVSSFLRRPDDSCMYARRVADAYEKILPAIHPVLGMYLMRLGVLQWQTQMKEAFETLGRAAGIISKTHGDGHPLFLDIVDLMRQCHHEMQMSPEVQTKMKAVRKEANLGIGKVGLPSN